MSGPTSSSLRSVTSLLDERTDTVLINRVTSCGGLRDGVSGEEGLADDHARLQVGDYCNTVYKSVTTVILSFSTRRAQKWLGDYDEPDAGDAGLLQATG